jgi:hypothetical protein
MSAPSFSFEIAPSTSAQGTSPLASQADPLGYDAWVREDLDPSGRSASGLELVDHAVLHRLSEDLLLLTGAPDDQVEFGVNVRKWIGEAVTEASLLAKGPMVEEAISRDPRIASVTAAVLIATGTTASRYGLLIHVAYATTTGQRIERVVGVSQVTVEFLAQGR